MKKLTVLFIAVLGSLTMVANTPKIDSTDQVRTKVIELLDNAPFKVSESIEAQVEFLITKKGEIIVTVVNCNNKEVENYVKLKLNYKKISNNNYGKPRFYKMPLKIINKA